MYALLLGVYMKKYVYADNAATTKLDKDAFEAMKPFLTNEYGNASQPYSFSRSAKKALKEARETIAGCINAEPEEIYFTSGGTESNNWAIRSQLESKKESHYITTMFEHHSVLNACKYIEKNHMATVGYLKPTSDGFIETSSLSRDITPDTNMVSIMYANNELGTVQQISDLCKIAHEVGAIFHTDAVQAVGHIPVDVKRLGVDLLSASAHKFNGPKGIGFLYVKNGVDIDPILFGGAQENFKRGGTENVPSIVGMACALKKNCDEMDQNLTYISLLEDTLINELFSLNLPIKNNTKKPNLPGVINISFAGKDGEAIMHRADLLGLCISTGSACDSVNTEISHVLKAIDLAEEYAKGTIRISLSKENTFDDIYYIAETLRKILI